MRRAIPGAKRYNLYLPEPLVRECDKIAFERGWSLSAWIRNLMEKEAAKRRKAPSTVEAGATAPLRLVTDPQPSLPGLPRAEHVGLVHAGNGGGS